MKVVNIRDWLTPDLSIPTEDLRIRRQALRVARLVEYGGPLALGHTRETLVECSRRPDRRQCLGLLWVTKERDGVIYAHCIACGADEMLISGWEETEWAEGPMEAAPLPSTE